MNPVSILTRGLMRGLIRLYQLVVSPILPGACRYLPTCSDYAMEAVSRHGPVLGGLLTARRLCRCHPWGGHGYDPVPDGFGHPKISESPAKGAE